jgi:lipopolysaccharide export system protein LptA
MKPFPRLYLAAAAGLFLVLPARAADTPLLTPPQSAIPQSTEITSQRAEMWSTDSETHAIFTGNVVVSGTNMRLTCDRLEIIASQLGNDKESTIPVLERFRYLLASGKVQIVQGDREAVCGRAEVFPREDKIVLKENPIVIDHGNDSKVIGDELWLFRGERRVQGINPRVVLPAIKDLGFDNSQPPPAATSPAPAASQPDATPAPQTK